MTDSLEDKIRARAYEIWEHEGRPHGKADEHWLRASLEVIGAMASHDLPSSGGPGEVKSGAITKTKKAAASSKKAASKPRARKTEKASV